MVAIRDKPPATLTERKTCDVWRTLRAILGTVETSDRRCALTGF